MEKSHLRSIQDFFYRDKIWASSALKPAQSEKSLRNTAGDFKTIYIHESEKLAIREYHMLYRKDCQLTTKKTDSSYVELSFFLHPHRITDQVDQRRQVYLPYHGYIHFIPKDSSIAVCLEKNKHYRHIDIYLELSHFQEWISVNPLVKNFIDAVSAGKAAHLFPQGIPICGEIAQMLTDIKSCDLDLLSQEYYIKGKIYLLLSLLFQKAQTKSTDKKTGIIGLRREEEQVLKQIGELLHENLDKFYTIEGLSQQFGINAFKLKKGFKQLFGTGIFEYAVNVKMEEAKRMIVSNKYTFKEIAFLLGYSAPSSFSVAFKRNTGLSPLQYSRGMAVDVV